MLRVSGLEGFYGASQALFGMAFAVDAGEMVTLMGRNGMGKTTTVHAVMGLLPARRGIVEFEGRRVDHLPAFRIARLGLGLVPEGRQIFPNLSVYENLVAASANRTERDNPWSLRVFPARIPRPTDDASPALRKSRSTKPPNTRSSERRARRAEIQNTSGPGISVALGRVPGSCVLARG